MDTEHAVCDMDGPVSALFTAIHDMTVSQFYRCAAGWCESFALYNEGPYKEAWSGLAKRTNESQVYSKRGLRSKIELTSAMNCWMGHKDHPKINNEILIMAAAQFIAEMGLVLVAKETLDAEEYEILTRSLRGIFGDLDGGTYGRTEVPSAFTSAWSKFLPGEPDEGDTKGSGGIQEESTGPEANQGGDNERGWNYEFTDPSS